MTQERAAGGVYWRIVELSGPILLVQLSVMGSAVVDTVMAGRRSAVDLAAVGVGASIYIVVFVAALGVLMTLQPAFAYLRGAGDSERFGEHAVQAMWTGVLLGLVGGLVLWNASPLLAWISPSAEVATLATGYLRGLAIALPAILLFRVFYAFSTVLGRASVVACINIAVVIAKIPVNILFMDALNLGASGCGVAMAIVSWISLPIAAAAVRVDKAYRQLALRPRLPRFPTVLQILKDGYPISMMQVAEIAAFAGMGLLAAQLGPLNMAAHQAAANVSTTLYMIPLSLALATSVLVSHALGGQDREKERAFGDAGLRCAVALGIGMAGSAVAFSDVVASMYSSDPRVGATLTTLLVWVSVSQLAECLQVYFICVLRSYQLTMVPFIINAISRGVIGLGLGSVLALGPTKLGVTGFWIGSAIGLTTCALLLWGYWWQSVSSRRHIQCCDRLRAKADEAPDGPKAAR